MLPPQRNKKVVHDYMPNKQRTLEHSDSAGSIKKKKKKLEVLIDALCFKEAVFLTEQLKKPAKQGQ